MKNLLLKENKKLLKDLHDVFAIDFNAHYTIREVNLPKTLNSIIKENSDVINKDTINVLLIQNRNYMDEYKVITFNRFGNYDIDIKTYWYNTIDCYYRKADFEKDRKESKLKAFVVIGYKNGVKSRERRDKTQELYYNNYNIRAKVDFNREKIAWSQFVNYKEQNCQLIGFDSIKLNNEIFDFNIKEMVYHPQKDYHAEDLIDKNGYNVFTKRKELATKLYYYKKEKRYIELEKQDFSKDKEEVKKAVYDCHKYIINKLQNIDAFDRNLKQIYYKLNNEYDMLVFCADSFISKIEEDVKRFGNMETFKSDKEEIFKKIENLKSLF